MNVLVFRTVGAPQRTFLARRRARRAEPGSVDPEPVPMSRITVIDSTGFDGEDAAQAWLEACRKDEPSREREVEAALAILNRAVWAHRVSAGDPYLGELRREDAQAIRLGYGAGEDVVEGQWRAAYTIPEPRKRQGRRQMLSPQEQVAAILSGRSRGYPSEDLALRARLDLDQGRRRQAALQVRAAFDALAAELAAEPDQGEALRRLRDRESGLRALEQTALAGELDDEQSTALSELLEVLERLLRRRRHAGA